MEVGDRVFKDAEWPLFAAGHTLLLDLIDNGLKTGENDIASHRLRLR